MSLDDIKLRIRELVNSDVTVQVNGSRSKTYMFRGVIDKVYSNIFTVYTDGVSKSFSYSDVAIGDVKIFEM